MVSDTQENLGIEREQKKLLQDLLKKLEFFGDKFVKLNEFGSSSRDWVANCQTNLDNFLPFYHEVKRQDVEFNFNTPETFSSFSQRVVSKGEAEGRSEAWINHALQLHYWNDVGDSFKLFSATNTLRTGGLVESIVRELRHDAFLSAAILARSLLESQATFRRQQLQLTEKLSNRLKANFGGHKGAEKELDDLIVKSIYASTHSSGTKDQEPTNILTQINKLGGDRQFGQLTSAYSFLCQLAHPTYFGSRIFADFSKVDEFGAHQTVISNIPSIGAFEAAYVTVWVLSWACSDVLGKQMEFMDALLSIAKEQDKHSKFCGFD